ncbi:MAG: hypothetical protein LBG94_00485 [Treponema sp.]|jgi:heme A synthase|nr:hypothetical protein [Treponema sp.]
MFLGIVLGLVIMGATVYMAINKKSTFHLRLVCLGALALMMITVIICLFVIFSDDTVVIDPSTLIVGEPAPVKEKDDSGFFVLIFSIIFFIILFAVIVFLTMREHKRSDN